MANELTPMQTLQESLREHTKDKFAELVPPEIWQQLADTTIKELMEKEFPKIVNEEMSKMCRAKITEMLNAPHFTQKWNSYGGHTASNALQQTLIDKAPELFAALIGSHLQGVIEQIKYRS